MTIKQIYTELYAIGQAIDDWYDDDGSDPDDQLAKTQESIATLCAKIKRNVEDRLIEPEELI